jgi:hypothetical protein
MDDARKGLSYAPYLMFVIERVNGYKFVKDGLHEQYKIEKARHAKAGDTIASLEDVPESSHSGWKKKNKMVQWIKAIFGKCTYAAKRAYETQMEQQEMRVATNLPPLPPPPPPPHYDLPSLSDSKNEDEEETKEEFDYQMTLGSTLRSMHHTRHTSTTHRLGRAVVSSDNDDDDNDGGDGRALGGDDVDWDNIEDDE